MKKIYLIAFTVLATLALGSCVKEIQDNGSDVALGKNDVAFVMKGGVGTRAGEAEVVSQGVSMPLGVTEDGISLYLEETVTDLDAVAPVTRGTPAYTENLGVLYANQLGVHAVGGSFGDATFETGGQPADGNGAWRYYHQYSSDPWPNDNDAVNFYLRMPATINGFTSTVNGVTATSTPQYDGGAIVINYTSPATAAAMQDILFGYLSINKTDYKKTLPNGAPVTLYHALTGVKFRIGNKDEDITANSIAIKEISFSGLKDKGTCTITPTEGTTSKAASVWSDLDVTEGASFSSGEYGTPVAYTEGGSFGEGAGNYPASFVAGDSDKNLNDAAASQTFWLIPQAMTSDIKLTITYTFGSGTYTGVLDFGEYLAAANVVWNPGELRTYTIRVEEVNVMIKDEVSISGSAQDGYKNSTKSNVTITNTGNTKAFMRAAIVGQWLDSEGNPVFGFTDKVNQLYLVESWYEDQFVKTEAGKHGVFTGLPGYKGAATFKADEEGSTAGWQLCTDGYYYYTKEVDPDATTGSSLFDSYTTLIAPKAELAGKILETAQMYFVLEVSTQAVTAVKRDGTTYTWKEAWKNATGVEPVGK